MPAPGAAVPVPARFAGPAAGPPPEAAEQLAQASARSAAIVAAASRPAADRWHGRLPEVSETIIAAATAAARA